MISSLEKVLKLPGKQKSRVSGGKNLAVGGAKPRKRQAKPTGNSGGKNLAVGGASADRHERNPRETAASGTHGEQRQAELTGNGGGKNLAVGGASAFSAVKSYLICTYPKGEMKPFYGCDTMSSQLLNRSKNARSSVVNSSVSAYRPISR